MEKGIILLLLGTVIGFMSSYIMWKVQIKYNKKNIAQGFYLEISSLEKTIELYANAFKNPGPGAGQVEILQPFYGDGLFFTFRKEMFGFNQNLSKNLFDFYNNLLAAERDRRVDKSNQFFRQANDEMKDSIKKAYILLPNLKELLKKEFS